MGTIDSYFQEISGAFINSPVVERYRIRERLVRQREGFIRIRSWLVNGDLFEAFEFITLEEEAIVLQTYRLHWQDKTGRLIRRWDNAPHCPELESFPTMCILPKARQSHPDRLASRRCFGLLRKKYVKRSLYLKVSFKKFRWDQREKPGIDLDGNRGDLWGSGGYPLCDEVTSSFQPSAISCQRSARNKRTEYYSQRTGRVESQRVKTADAD